MQAPDPNPNRGHMPGGGNPSSVVQSVSKPPVVVQPQASMFQQHPRLTFPSIQPTPISVAVSQFHPMASNVSAASSTNMQDFQNMMPSLSGMPSQVSTMTSQPMPPAAHHNPLSLHSVTSTMQPLSLTSQSPQGLPQRPVNQALTVPLATQSHTPTPPNSLSMPTSESNAPHNASAESAPIINQIFPGFPPGSAASGPHHGIPSFMSGQGMGSQGHGSMNSATPSMLPNRPTQIVPPTSGPVVQPLCLTQPVPSGTAPTGAAVGHQAQQFQRLKVEDALSYLDQVKLQFGNHPQVYNDFLDIMKEFKSQSIDTPGVISRVSNLFKGHPDLIVGFNTFLPPGYKIEVQANDTISVQQPGQPSMSLSQLTGSREHREPPRDTRHAQPLNLAVKMSENMGRMGNNIDNMVAAAATGATTAPGQPVEFTHAINYVNKIKNRFQGQPDIYKDFLEILHKYQKEQRQIKENMIPPGYKPLTEQEVYSQVAKLFQNQEDLLKEFWKFLPDASDSSSGLFAKGGLFGDIREAPPPKKPQLLNKSSRLLSNSIRKHPSTSTTSSLPSKKSKPSGSFHRDISLAEAGKYGSLAEFSFFDKVRVALKSDEVYRNFLRCLKLFNEGILSRSELTQIIQPFLAKFPDLMKKFKGMIGHDGSSGPVLESVASTMLQPKTERERMTRDDLAMEIDYSSCKRYGHSYRGLPKSYHPPRCSGRTAMCREVLNDHWVSLPSWSEESTFVTSRKTQFEENIYRCEDERFELDMVIEPNLATIKVLEVIEKKLSKMSPEDASKYKLDNSLGGQSEVVHRKAIHRIYGDKASEIIDGLKKNPAVVVPLVLRRLKSKDEEWREAQRQFNKIWREQNERFYLKSLDHQGISFKQNDIKNLRSKALLNEIECVYAGEVSSRKKTAAIVIESAEGAVSATSVDAESRPHMVLGYKDTRLITDALNLVLHHARRQASTSTSKEDKQAMKEVMRQHVQRLFHRPELPVSDDEDDDDDQSGSEDAPPKRSRIFKANGVTAVTADTRPQLPDEPLEQSSDKYTLFYANTNWYLLLRLHQLLCERLYKIRVQCDRIVEEHDRCLAERNESTAVALRLKTPNDTEPRDYYSTFLELIESLLDGNIECTYFEDQLREMFGIHAYIAFTLDKVVQNIVKQLQYVVTDDVCQSLMNLWGKEAENQATGDLITNQSQNSAAEMAYQKKVEQMLTDDNCFKIVMTRDALTLSMTLLDNETDSRSSSTLAAEIQRDQQWHAYVDKFVSASEDPELSTSVKEHLQRTPIFMHRNKRKTKASDETEQPHSANKEDEGGESIAADKEMHDSAEPVLPPDMEVEEGQACDFDPNNYKTIYHGQGSRKQLFVYKRGSLHKAKATHPKVSAVMYKRWDELLSTWRDKNVPGAELRNINQWLMGENAEGSRPCKTNARRDNDVTMAPYRPYTRYQVVYENVAVVSSAPDDGSLTALNNADFEPMDMS